ncbi:hypothetical protein [Desulfoluna sp.]|uniref:hypothetical protein n=1 Tax=Desulfoluna sp. TaxID=2045199 RepID=UPI00261DB6B9|nr:hypothetical protein [Desulfoluna sp.]
MKSLRFILLLGLFIALASPALAHRINIFALDEGGEVYTESTFAGKRPVKKGVIRVFNVEGTLVYTGQTDEKGICTFPRPEPGALTLEVDAGMGHKNSWALESSDPAVASNEPVLMPNDSAVVPPKTASVGGLSPADWKRMEQVVDTAVAKSLHQAREETRLQDIVGGIGYIVGFFGLFAWIRSRREAV